jgi:hypothetical protein
VAALWLPRVNEEMSDPGRLGARAHAIAAAVPTIAANAARQIGSVPTLHGSTSGAGCGKPDTGSARGPVVGAGHQRRWLTNRTETGLPGWAYRIRTGESVCELSGWISVTTWA